MSEWRAILKFPGYEVSSAGELRRSGDTSALPVRIDGHGYHRRGAFGPDGKYRFLSVHVAVLEAFVGPRPPKHDASHVNGVQIDNRLENLRWETASANHRRKLEHGTLVHGEAHKCSKLKVHQVSDIRRRAASGEPKINMARQYGVSNTLICNIVAGKAWPHLAQIATT